MRIFKRLSDIISSNLNDLLDRAEDPGKMVKQVLREMEAGLESAKRVTTQALTEEKKLSKELEHNRALVDEWQGKAVQAVEADRDDLAKKALARKVEIESVVGSLEAQHQTAVDYADGMKKTLKALEARLAEAKRRQATLVARKRLADAKKTVVTHMERVKQEEGDLAASEKLDRLEADVLDSELEAAARLEVAGEDAEPGDAGSNPHVEAELEKIKRAHKDKK